MGIITKVKDQIKEVTSKPIIKYSLWIMLGFSVTLLCGLVVLFIFNSMGRFSDFSSEDSKYRVPSSEFSLDVINADVEVYGMEGDAVNITLEGPEKIIGKIKIDDGTKKLKISNKAFLNLNMFGIGLKNERVKIKVELPQNLELDIRIDDSSRINVYNYKGSLAADLNGPGQIDSINSEFADAVIDIEGPGSVDVDKLIGKAEIEIVGPGMVNIEEVELVELEAEILGTGILTVKKGSIENAEVTINGSGSVNIPKVTYSFVQDISGTGEVNFSGN